MVVVGGRGKRIMVKILYPNKKFNSLKWPEEYFWS
jgi:hypothetical protein